MLMRNLFISFFLLGTTSTALAQICTTGYRTTSMVTVQGSATTTVFWVDVRDNKMQLRVRFGTSFDYATYGYRSSCSARTAELRETNNQAARNALLEQPTRVVKDVPPDAIFFQNPRVIAEMDGNRTVTRTRHSETNLTITENYSNPQMQALLDDCNAKLELAKSSNKEILVTPYAHLIGLPICSVAQ